MDRRQALVTIAGLSGIGITSGCLEEMSDGSTTDDPSSSNGDVVNTNSGGENGDNEGCTTEIETQTEEVVSTSREVEGGYSWTHEYKAEADDTVYFDISASAQQDVEVEIEAPGGQTLYSESGGTLNTVHQLTEDGRGEVRVTNLGERTEENRVVTQEDRVDVSAGNTIDYWVENYGGDAVDYYVREVSGARPQLRIEDSSGNVLREHSVSSVIEDEFTVPDNDRYYFIIENTALLTSGTWDYTFERVEENPIPTTVDLQVEREYEEEVEVCE